jgi:hypothetical protein
VDREPSPPPSGPVPSAPVTGGGLAPDLDDPMRGATPDWVDDAEWARMCADWAARDDDEEPADPVEAFYADPDCGPPPDWEQPSPEEFTAQAEADTAEDAALMARLLAAGLDGYAHDRARPPRIIDLDKARTIAQHCANLTLAEALAAEKILLGLEDVEEMTWGRLRDRIARAVMEVNPGAARRRRERAERERRVEVRPELFLK